MGLGMPEVVLILVIALIVFGPRKLPELGKSLGQAMNQFRRASDDFKRTWEQEVELDKSRSSGSESSSYGYDSSDSSSYTSLGDEPDKDQPSLQNGDAGTSSTQENQQNGQNGTTPEPAAATITKPAEKQHWI